MKLVLTVRMCCSGMAPGTAPMCGDVPCLTGDAAGMAPPAGEDGVALTIDSPPCSSGAPVIGCPNYQP